LQFQTPQAKNFSIVRCKWFQNLRTIVPNPLLTCRKWWCAGYCGLPEYQTLTCHCLWYPRLRSLTNSIPHSGTPESLKLRKACGIDGIPNECLRHITRRPLVNLTKLFNQLVRLSRFSKSWEEAKMIVLPKPGKNSKLPKNLCPISLLFTKGKRFEKVILKAHLKKKLA
jgi:hypothetical protein